MDYKILRSNRKTLSISITKKGEVLVRAPLKMSKKVIGKFLEEKASWIDKNIAKQLLRDSIAMKEFTDKEEKNYRNMARTVIEKQCEYYGSLMNVSYNRIAIKDTKTRWGSCSSKENLNFSWRLILMPPRVLDYVVVHELAHLKEMNHSAKFWIEVEKILPDYKERKRWLKENG